MRCHAGQCTNPDSLSPEDAVDDGGMPAHPQCATYADEPTDAGRARTPCPVGYCHGEAGHATLHDIRACLSTCGPIRPRIGRDHDPVCPNAYFYATVAASGYEGSDLFWGLRSSPADASRQS